MALQQQDSSNDAGTALRRRRALQSAIQPAAPADGISAPPPRSTFSAPPDQAPDTNLATQPTIPTSGRSAVPSNNTGISGGMGLGPGSIAQAATGGVPLSGPTATTTGSSAGPAPTGLGQYANLLEGFNSDKLNDPGKHDPKYDFARIASNFPPTPDGLKAAFAQIQAAYPNAKLVGDDKVDFADGYGPVDMIRASGEGGKAWHFEGQDTGQVPANPALQAAILPTSSTGTPMPTDPNSPDYIALLQQLMQQSPAAQAPQRTATADAIQRALQGRGASVRV